MPESDITRALSNAESSAEVEDYSSPSDSDPIDDDEAPKQSQRSDVTDEDDSTSRHRMRSRHHRTHIMDHSHPGHRRVVRHVPADGKVSAVPTHRMHKRVQENRVVRSRSQPVFRPHKLDVNPTINIRPCTPQARAQGGVSSPRTDIFIVASGKGADQYRATTIPRWRAYAVHRGYGFHVIRNVTFCEPPEPLPSLTVAEAARYQLPDSETAQTQWAKVCLAKDLLSTTPWKRLAAFNLDTSADVVARTSGNFQGGPLLEAATTPEESYVIIVDADTMVLDPDFDLVSTARPYFDGGAGALMLEDRSSANDTMCFGNGQPKGAKYTDWPEGVCLPQSSFIMLKRGEKARKFVDQWIEDAASSACGWEASDGIFRNEQGVLKKCTVPAIQAQKLLRVVNGHNGIMTNSQDVTFMGIQHFAIGTKSNIPKFIEATQARFDCVK